MVEKELHDLIKHIQIRGCEGQTTEVKAAHQECPEKLYDTISAFSNQNSGGISVFGLDEKSGFAKVGVYDARDLERKVMEYCEQMTPVVRPPSLPRWMKKALRLFRPRFRPSTSPNGRALRRPRGDCVDPISE